MRMKAIVGSLAAAMMIAGSAQADSIAGWDFSQVAGDGVWSIDEEINPIDTLGANYSDLDPNGLGPGSAPFGTLYFNGDFGTSIVDQFGTDFAPTDLVPRIASNNHFISENASLHFAAGSPFYNLNLSVRAGLGETATVVFAGTPGADADGWSISFGGRTNSGNALIGVEFSGNGGGTWIDLGQVQLNNVDSPFTLAPDAGILTSQGLFRLSLDGTSTSPYIDNVLISATPQGTVPEPTTMVLLGFALAGIGTFSRRSA